MYNENEINPELEGILDNAFSRYMQDEYEYQQLAVQILDNTLDNDPEAQRLINTFESLGATNLQAKIKLAELMIDEM